MSADQCLPFLAESLLLLWWSNPWGIGRTQVNIHFYIYSDDGTHNTYYILLYVLLVYITHTTLLYVLLVYICYILWYILLVHTTYTERSYIFCWYIMNTLIYSTNIHSKKLSIFRYFAGTYNTYYILLYIPLAHITYTTYYYIFQIFHMYMYSLLWWVVSGLEWF